MKSQADVVLAVRIPPALKRQLRRLADEDKRSLSNLVDYLLSLSLPQYLERVKQSREAA